MSWRWKIQGTFEAFFAAALRIKTVVRSWKKVNPEKNISRERGMVKKFEKNDYDSAAAFMRNAFRLRAG